ncbi:MAG: hypothetical protein WC334_09245 [Kiritimatiellales bacterium]|jgi:hypothetical protein
MKKIIVFTAAGLVAAGVWAGSYSQNFNSASGGTTNLGDGTTISDTGTGHAQVWDNGGSWKALRLTQDSNPAVGGASTFALYDLDAGNAVQGFTATFDVLIKNDMGIPADGFSFNFGTLGTLPYGGEEGMYAGTGSMLSIGWDTYDNGGGDPQSIEVYVNGVSVGNSTVKPPVISSFLSDPFQTVSIAWNSGGLDVTYDGTAIFTDLNVSGFTPLFGAQFAFAARTGGEDEDVFIDSVSVNTIPEPVGISLVATVASMAWFIRRRFID